MSLQSFAVSLVTAQQRHAGVLADTKAFIVLTMARNIPTPSCQIMITLGAFVLANTPECTDWCVHRLHLAAHHGVL